MYIVTSIQLMYVVCTLQLDLMHCSSTAPCPTLACTVRVCVCMTLYVRWLTTSTSTVNVHSAHGPTVICILNGLILVLVIGLYIMAYIAEFQTSGHLDFVLFTKVL